MYEYSGLCNRLGCIFKSEIRSNLLSSGHFALPNCFHQSMSSRLTVLLSLVPVRSICDWLSFWLPSFLSIFSPLLLRLCLSSPFIILSFCVFFNLFYSIYRLSRRFFRHARQLLCILSRFFLILQIRLPVSFAGPS